MSTTKRSHIRQTAVWAIALSLILIASVAIAQAQSQIRIGELVSENQREVAVPVYLSSDSAITFIQFIVEYDATVLQLRAPRASLGSQAGNLSISLVNDNLPFPPVNPLATDNMVVQLSGSGSQTITGDSLEIARLHFFVDAAYGDSLSIWLDGSNGRSLLTTTSLVDIQDENLELVAGAVLVRDLTAPASAITSPLDGASLETDSLVIEGTSGDATGSGVVLVEISLDDGMTWQTVDSDHADFAQWEYLWQPVAPGSYSLRSRATDVAGNVETPTAAVQIEITAAPQNVAPQIAAIRDTSIEQGETFRYQVSATDANPGDVLSFSDNTSLFDIDAETGRIEFTATNDDVGVHSITIYVSDGELSDSTSFTLTVMNVNDKPLPFVLLAPPDGAELESLQPTLVWQQAIDIDPGDALIYHLLISTQMSFADTVLSVETNDTSYTLAQALVYEQTYYWKVRAIDLAGAVVESQQVFSFQTIIVDLDDVTGGLPTTFALQQNYPNPFNPETRIRFSLPQASQVRLEVHNLLGQRIAVLLDESRAPGEHSLSWQAIDASGRRVPSGIYILSLHASDPVSGRLRFAQTRKMVVVE